MKINPGCTISLTTAGPGSVVRIKDVTTRTFPVVAWAVVAQGAHEDGGTDTSIEAVFEYDGDLWNGSEWLAAMGPARALTVVGPR